jgi:hypothetical protein
MEPNLQVASLEEYTRQWQAAQSRARELQQTYDKLADALRQLATYGAHTTVVFSDPLAQAWWVAYQERAGNMVPRAPDEVPITMAHEDQIVALHTVPEPQSLRA